MSTAATVRNSLSDREDQWLGTSSLYGLAEQLQTDPSSAGPLNAGANDNTGKPSWTTGLVDGVRVGCHAADLPFHADDHGAHRQHPGLRGAPGAPQPGGGPGRVPAGFAGPVLRLTSPGNGLRVVVQPTGLRKSDGNRELSFF